MTFQNTLLRYREEKHGDSKMRFRTDKILGGLNINGIKNTKAAKSEGSKIGPLNFGYYKASGESLSVGPKSSLTIPQAIVDRYASVEMPKGKPTQLVISDADYIPDQEYADFEN